LSVWFFDEDEEIIVFLSSIYNRNVG